MTRVAAGPDTGALWHGGDPLREQRQLLAGSAWVDLSHRPVLRIAGPDRLTWLHALTSQAFTGLQPGQRATALFLDANGRVRWVLTGIDDGEAFVGHTEPGMAEPLLAHLASMVFLTRVEPALVPGATVAGLGDGTCLVTGAADELPPERAGMWAWEALRIARGEPRIGVDTDERTIPNELGLYGTALDKGCYPGQETVGRVHTLGRPPRRLVRLSLDGGEDRLPQVGADISLDGRRVGRVGSSARHYEAGPVALGLVQRAVPVAATLVVDGIAATQEALVDPEVGEHVRPLRDVAN